MLLATSASCSSPSHFTISASCGSIPSRRATAWVMSSPPRAISRLKQVRPARSTLIEVRVAPTSTRATAGGIEAGSTSGSSSSGRPQSSHAFASAKRSRSIAMGASPAASTVWTRSSMSWRRHAATRTGTLVPSVASVAGPSSCSQSSTTSSSSNGRNLSASKRTACWSSSGLMGSIDT